MTPRRDNSHEKPETKTDHQQNSTSSVSGTSRTERHSGIPRTKTQSSALPVCQPFPPDHLLSHVTATAVVNILHDGQSRSQQTRGLLTHEWQSLSFVSGLTRLFINATTVLTYQNLTAIQVCGFNTYGDRACNRAENSSAVSLIRMC